MTSEEFAARFPATTHVYQAGLAAGLHLGAQICIARRGQVLADVGLGRARLDVAMSADSIMPWLSSGKPVTAVAVMQLHERGRVDLDDPVSRYLPEFAVRGKADVTIRHLLTHTAGFRLAPIGLDARPWDEIIRQICGMKLENNWVPGQKAGYHPLTSWFILGELVHRVAGRALAEYVRQKIFIPLGMRDSWIGMPPARYRDYGDRIGSLPDVQKPGMHPSFYSTEQGAVQGSPGAGTLGPMHDLGRFYQMLLNGGELDGAAILQPESVKQMISRQRSGMYDETFHATIDWGLGLILDSKNHAAELPPYSYGRLASSRAFGHGGSQSSVGFADPEYDLVVALIFNGTPGEGPHQSRIRAALEALYTDLGLVGYTQTGS